MEDDIKARAVTTVPAADRSFEAFFADKYASTVRLARLLSGSATIAEDLAQDAFVRVHPHFDHVDHPNSYLRTTTVNVCRNWHRSRERERDRFRRHGPMEDVAPDVVVDELGASILRLPFQQRAVIVLRYWADLSEAEIAAALECRPGTVKSLHHRAMQTLRREVQP